MPEDATQDEELTFAQAASRLGIGERTLWRWLQRGLVPGAWQPDRGYPWRIPAGAIDELRRRGVKDG